MSEPSRGERARLLAALMARFFGSGFWAPLQVLFFVRIAGIPTFTVSMGLTVATVVGLVAGPFIGGLADRYGTRNVGVGVFGFAACASATLVLVDSVPTFLLAITLISIGRGGQAAVSGALVAAVAGDSKLDFRARVYSMQNLVMTIGPVFGGLVLQADDRRWYMVAIAVEVTACLVACLCVATLSTRPTALPKAEHASASALRDRPFMVVSGLSGVLVLFDAVQTVLLPLWVTQRTDAPRWIISAVFIMSSVIVVAFQRRVSAGTEDVGVGARVLRRTAPLAVIALALFFSASYTRDVVTIALLLCGLAFLTWSEMCFAAGEYSLSYGLARDERHGQYQGAFAVGVGLGSAAAPPVVTGLCLGLGPAGWAVLASLLLGAGALVPAATRSASAAIAASRETTRDQQSQSDPV
ncbi:MFS transporter [Streptomyces sp. NPDC059340]|uniref:MFS transporter n=1 Tax=Streptomyces sp. NPDC059340 TaxID=3346806 RepID=UPI00369C283F